MREDKIKCLGKNILKTSNSVTKIEIFYYTVTSEINKASKETGNSSPSMSVSDNIQYNVLSRMTKYSTATNKIFTKFLNITKIN